VEGVLVEEDEILFHFRQEAFAGQASGMGGWIVDDDLKGFDAGKQRGTGLRPWGGRPSSVNQMA